MLNSVSWSSAAKRVITPTSPSHRPILLSQASCLDMKKIPYPPSCSSDTHACPSAASSDTIILVLSQSDSHSAQKIKCQIQYSTTNAATIMPLSLNIATLFPDAAMRVSRLAEPLRDVAMLEKVSFCMLQKDISVIIHMFRREGGTGMKSKR